MLILSISICFRFILVDNEWILLSCGYYFTSWKPRSLFTHWAGQNIEGLPQYFVNIDSVARTAIVSVPGCSTPMQIYIGYARKRHCCVLEHEHGWNLLGNSIFRPRAVHRFILPLAVDQSPHYCTFSLPFYIVQLHNFIRLFCAKHQLGD